MACLTAFEAAVRHGNFSHAANELASTQPAVSRQIKQLEDFLGVPLFERRHRDVVVTEHGRYLAEIVSVTLGEIASASDRLRMTASTRDVFRIQVEAEHANSAVLPHLPELGLRYPGVHFDILMSANPVEIPSAPFDIAFHTDPMELKNHTRTAVSDEWIIPVCSPAFAETLPAAFTGADIANARLIHYQNPYREYTNWYSFLAPFGITIPDDSEGPTFSQYAGSLSAAEHGAGIALGWYSQAKARLETGRLVRVSDLSMYLPDGFGIYTDDRCRTHPMTASVIDFFCNKIEHALGEDQYRVR